MTAAPESATTLLVIAKQPRARPGQDPPGAAVHATSRPPRWPRPRSPTPCTPCWRRRPGARVLVLDGQPGPWLPPGFDVVPQCGGAARRAPRRAFAARARPGAADRDGHAAAHPGAARRGLGGRRRRVRPGRRRRVLGARPARRRTPPCCAASRCRPRAPAPSSAPGCVAAGLRVADLPRLRDVDTAADAVAVARQAPRSRFAARARELAAVLSRRRRRSGAIAGNRMRRGSDRPVRGGAARAGRGAGPADRRRPRAAAPHLPVVRAARCRRRGTAQALPRPGPRRGLRPRPADHGADRARDPGAGRGHLAGRGDPDAPGRGTRPAPLGVRSAARAGPVGHRAARGRQHRHRRPARPAPAPLRRAARAGRPDPDRGRARRRRRAADRVARAPRRPARPGLPWACMGTAALLRPPRTPACTSMDQWRHADRAFVLATRAAAQPERRERTDAASLVRSG